MSTPSNRRQYFRLEKNAAIALFPFDPYQELQLPSKANISNASTNTELKNLGAGGVLIETEKPYALGDIVKLQITLKDWEAGQLALFQEAKAGSTLFRTIARVVRVEWVESGCYDIGFEFVGIAPEEKESLNRYLLSQMKTRKNEDSP